MAPAYFLGTLISHRQLLRRLLETLTADLRIYGATAGAQQPLMECILRVSESPVPQRQEQSREPLLSLLFMCCGRPGPHAGNYTDSSDMVEGLAQALPPLLGKSLPLLCVSASLLFPPQQGLGEAGRVRLCLREPDTVLLTPGMPGKPRAASSNASIPLLGMTRPSSSP